MSKNSRTSSNFDETLESLVLHESNGNDRKNVGSGTIPDQMFGDKRTATYTHGGLLEAVVVDSPLVRVVESFVRDLPKMFNILYRITNATFHFSKSV